MAKFDLTINTDNAAFEDDNRDREIARCLRAIADRIESGDSMYDTFRNILDINGNHVGTFALKPHDKL